MKLIKPHNVYPQFASVYKTIFKTSRLKIVVQEFYIPHWLEFSVWKSGQKLGFYILDDVCGIGVCNLFGVYYEKWFPYNWLHLIIILLMSIAIFFMGMFISGRKEFLNAK